MPSWRFGVHDHDVRGRMNKKALTEADIRTKFITPALVGANGDKWNVMTQIREEAYFTKGRVIVRGRTVRRGEARKADYILYHKPNLPIAVIEAKDNNHSVGDGMQQALEYAEVLDVPFAYSSNGDAFLEHDRTVTGGTVTREIPLDQFPTPEELWARYRKAKGFTADQEAVATQDYYEDGSQKAPRYYQLIAINRTVDAIARGENRILLVMATGTGKTYTAFQIIWRLWKSGTKKRILFLVDRNILADQTKTNDFKPFGQAMTKITNRTVDKSFEIYLCLYQAVTGTEEEQNIYKQFSPDFFDLVVVDECHRGSAADDAAWRKVLEYFLRQRKLGAWTKDDPEAQAVRAIGRNHPPDQADPSHYSRWLDHADAAVVANTLICLIHQTNYLLDQQLRALEAQFIQGGGYSEQLAAARVAHRRDQADQSGPPDQSAQPAGPACRLCGQPMVLRTARQGARAGSQFWGCSAYPKCKATQPV